MENLNEVTLSLAILISPAFSAYLFLKKFSNKSTHENMNIALVISLVTFNFIIIGFVQSMLSILEIIIQILSLFFSERSSKIFLTIIQSISIIVFLITIVFLRKKFKKFSKEIQVQYRKCGVLVLIIAFLGLATDIDLARDLFDNEKFLIALNKIQASPIAIILNTSIGIILLMILEKFFADSKVPKLNTKECDYMYPSKFFQENSIISKPLKEISLTKFSEVRVSISKALEHENVYEFEFQFYSEDILHIFLNKEFSLFQFKTKIDNLVKEDLTQMKKIIKNIFYENYKINALIEIYKKSIDEYLEIDPLVEDENIEIYISEDDTFIINIKFKNKDIYKYL